MCMYAERKKYGKLTEVVTLFTLLIDFEIDFTVGLRKIRNCNSVLQRISQKQLDIILIREYNILIMSVKC